jgi:hypothetical protein
MSNPKGATGILMTFAASDFLLKVVQKLRMPSKQQKWLDVVALCNV